MTKKEKVIALYFGSFNPLHEGHLHVRDKAAEIVDNVKLVRIINVKKIGPISTNKLIDVIYTGNPLNLVHDMEKMYEKVVIIRGIRNERDYYFESSFFNQLKIYKPNLKIMYIFCDEEFKNYSSSWIKELSQEDQAKYIV